MTVSKERIFLLDVRKKSPVEAELWDAITDKQLADWEKKWLPETMKGLKASKAAGITANQSSYQSAHWNWRKKAEKFKELLAYQGFSIVCDEITQGMMFVDKTTKQTKHPDYTARHQVYIDYLESAPWNRKTLINALPQYRGIGSILIRKAIDLSIEEGFKGRIGLHSLPQSEHFYGHVCGMTDLGQDKAYLDLRYFEMTAEQADTFVKKGEVS